MKKISANKIDNLLIGVFLFGVFALVLFDGIVLPTLISTDKLPLFIIVILFFLSVAAIIFGIMQIINLMIKRLKKTFMVKRDPSQPIKDL
jgi:hypothetical protein